ncbi:MAG TPA: DUF4136 domain-containing protein [Chitinophagaceae bacterium]|nr:DUF4136 domain-containing protein [Chitinophagaceae bacterium]
MKKYAVVPVALLALLVLASCTKDPVSKLSSEETRIYITNHDSTTNFSNFKTFSISDSVAIISDNHLQQKTHDAFDAVLINAVADAMTQRGYTRVANDQHPSLGINVNNIINTYTGFVDYGNYYNDYLGYWDPYYWGYPGYNYYGSYIGTYQVNEGVISIDMFDLQDAAASGRIKSVWNGVVRGEAIFKEANVAPSIKALFDQSPYLKSNL